MGQTTIKVSNVNKPAPRWWRKLDDAVLFIIIPITTLVLQGWGFKPEQQKNVDRANLIVAVALPIFMKGMGKILANGEEYAKTLVSDEKENPQ